MNSGVSLITGASGFIGSALTQTLAKQGFDFVPFSRTDNACIFTEHAFTAIVHLAARVHVVNESATDPMAEFRQSNVVETLALARRAAAAGVKRFVYVSSIGVNGDATAENQAFTEQNTVYPHNAYAQSKHEGELALTQLATETGLEVVIVRPPLVYGPGAPGNFGTLLKYLAKGIPLPLGAIHNQRSMVYVGNLVDFLILCAQPSRSPLAANETFLISDGQNVSTTYLLKTLAQAQGQSIKLLPVPAAWLRFTLKCLNKQSVAQRLLGDLQIDSSKARRLLGWQPPYTVEQGLSDCVSKNTNNIKDNSLKRIFDLILVLFSIGFVSVPLFVVAVAVWLTSSGPILYWSDRVGRGNQIFKMPKFRSMLLDTPAVASDKLQNPETYLTPIGSFLRKSSLDELPQLWSILVGDMSFVGPRPALFNQYDLILMRTDHDVHRLMPGLTGWAQVNGRDELPLVDKVNFDVSYLKQQSFWFDIRILWMTFVKVIRRDNVTH